ncbi:MAG: PilZ domain-containing protein [Rudaea sp.]|nr:PilZ domain-containing protein [Rudaea sp.]
MSFAEKRRHPRLAIYSAAFAVTDGQGYLSDVKDLSQGGACIGRPKNWPDKLHENCRVFFIFDQETVIGIDVRIARSGTEDLGLEFLPGQDQRVESLLYESRFLDREAL